MGYYKELSPVQPITAVRVTLNDGTYHSLGRAVSIYCIINLETERGFPWHHLAKVLASPFPLNDPRDVVRRHKSGKYCRVYRLIKR